MLTLHSIGEQGFQNTAVKFLQISQDENKHVYAQTQEIQGLPEIVQSYYGWQGLQNTDGLGHDFLNIFRHSFFNSFLSASVIIPEKIPE